MKRLAIILAASAMFVGCGESSSFVGPDCIHPFKQTYKQTAADRADYAQSMAIYKDCLARRP